MSAVYAAVVTAGARVDDTFAAVLGTPVKALAPFAGSTPLRRTIDALRNAGIERIAVIGGDEVRASCEHLVERIVAEAPSGAENQRLALHTWEPETPLLYATSDMPFITAGFVRDFLDRAGEEMLGVPVAEGVAFDARFPGAPPFGVTLAGERVVNGGVFALPAGAAPGVEALALKFFNARKSPWAMATLAGLPLLLRFALRRLSIADLERRAFELLGIRARAIRNCAPELAYDIDTLAEYEYARSIA